MSEDIRLVSITAYAKHFKIDRKTVYNLIDQGKITRYRGLDNEPLLNINERPTGVKRYGDRKRKIA